MAYLGKIKTKSTYSAQCTSCGEIHPVNGQDLRTGRSKCCTKCAAKQAGIDKIGKPRVNRTPKEMREKYLFASKRKDALKRGFSWKITLADFLNLIYKNCAYCNRAPSTTVNILKNRKLAPFWTNQGNITYNGIDRVDSSKGYTSDNAVTCCYKCNSGKMDMSLAEFKEWIREVSTHLLK